MDELVLDNGLDGWMWEYFYKTRSIPKHKINSIVLIWTVLQYTTYRFCKGFKSVK